MVGAHRRNARDTLRDRCAFRSSIQDQIEPFVDGMARYPDLLTRIATELRPGELGLAALLRRVIGADDIVLNAALAVVLYAIGATAVFIRSRMFTVRVVDLGLNASGLQPALSFVSRTP